MSGFRVRRLTVVMMVTCVWWSTLGYFAPNLLFAQAPAAAPAAPTVESQSFLSYLMESSGIFGLIILICSFVLVAVVSMLILQLRRDAIIPAEFIEEFEKKVVAKDYQGAYETAKADESTSARVLAAGLARINKGPEEAEAGMQSVVDEENMGIEHKLGYLALIGTLGPMLGLLGTVQGMIMSFREIASNDAAPKPKDLAKGISTGLVITLEGLIVAIPAMIAYNVLKNHAGKMNFELNKVTDGLMSRILSAVSTKKPAEGAAPPLRKPRPEGEQGAST